MILGKGVSIVVVVSALLFGGLTPTAFAEPASAPPPVEPANLGDLKIVATDYSDSGAYDADLAAAAAPATAWVNDQAPRVERPAVVFDIDETALSNWEALKANDFGRVIPGPCDTLPAGPCGLQAWDLSSRSTVIAPTLDIFTTARDRGAAVFFITGRPESQRAATERNLAATGYAGYAGLFMEPDGSRYMSAADFKAPQRELIQQRGYTIIANIGDQPSDLDGGFSQQTFLLPNPFYRIP